MDLSQIEPDMDMLKKTSFEALPQELITKLSDTFQRISQLGVSVASAIESDHLAGYPAYVPTYGDSESEHTCREARLVAIRSMTRLTIQPDSHRSLNAGILCSSPDTVLAVHAYNDAKDAFKQAVQEIRHCQSKSSVDASRISRLIENEISDKGYRNGPVSRAMNTLRISDLDLKRCYTRIRIMPPNLEVFSWSWTTKHARIIKMSHQEALKMAAEWPDQRVSAIAVDVITRRCDPQAPLARKIPLPNQLRANYAYLSQGEIVRASTPISGVVIAQQNVLPRRLWRPDPGISGNDAPRITRRSSLEAQPVVEALKLYRYV
jgi:hypothetical protein